MTHTDKVIQKLRAKAEASMNKAAELQQVIAIMEASLTREENQKVTEKVQNR